MSKRTGISLLTLRAVLIFIILLLFSLYALFIKAGVQSLALPQSNMTAGEQVNGTIPSASNLFLPLISSGSSQGSGQADPTAEQIVPVASVTTPTGTVLATSTPNSTITPNPTAMPTQDAAKPTPSSPNATPTVEATATPTTASTNAPTISPTIEVTESPTVEATETVIPTSTPATTATDQPEPTPDGTINFTIGMTATQGIQADGLTLRSLAVNAVFLASQTANTGQPITTGTLDIIDPSTVTYNAEPLDRLVVNLADGRTFTEYVTTMTGSNTSTLDSFLSNAHQLDVRIVTSPLGAAPDPNVDVPPNADIQLTSNLENGETTIVLNGQMESAGGPVTVNLTSVGTRYFESSFGGTEDRSNSTLVGTVVGANFDITVDEAYANTRVVFEGESASTADADIRNAWTVQDISYAIQNGVIRRSFRDGFVNENELSTRWQATGDLLRNGQAVGALQMNIGSEFVDVVVTEDGDIHRLQRFMRP